MSEDFLSSTKFFYLTMISETFLKEHIHHFLQDLYKEYDGDKEAVVIIQQYIRTKQISETQEIVLKTQLMDSLKIVGIGIPFAIIPGASVLMPLIIKVAEEHHINLLPSDFENSN